MGLKKIIKMFDYGNVCVCGLRGRGKDMLFANVVLRRGLPYVSNVDYGGDFHRFCPDDIDCGLNKYNNFLSGQVNFYEFPFPDGTDIYLSDAGVYFPSQYCNELNRQFPYLATFSAVSRHVGLCNFHFNVQNLNRVWDKIREQSDSYIMCNWCRVICGFVIQRVTVYDRYQSAVDRVPPYKRPSGFMNSSSKVNVALEKSRYTASYGTIKRHLLIYRNKSNYNTRVFRDIMLAGQVPASGL